MIDPLKRFELRHQFQRILPAVADWQGMDFSTGGAESRS
jgi:hypothetical protein